MSSIDDQGCDCGEAAPPPERKNPPGQRQLAYRIGTHQSFFRRAVEALARTEVPPALGVSAGDPRPLRALTTRALDDGTIALLDAWAAVGDVVTFYQERIVNEGYLGTAGERRSLVAIARLLGYEPNPGVAAGVRLALTVDAAAPLSLPVGLAVLSMPGEGELPQSFETVEPVEARKEWNALAAGKTRLHRIEKGTTELYLAGITTGLAEADPLVIVGRERELAEPGSERWDLRFVSEVKIDPERDFTWVRLDRPLGGYFEKPAEDHAFVLTFRDRGALFGHNAADFRLMNEKIQADLGLNGDWKGFPLTDDPAVANGAIDLDREYADVVTRTWVCLQDRHAVELYKITKVSPSARADFSLAGRCTRLHLDHLARRNKKQATTSDPIGDFGRRSTIVHLQSQVLPVAEEPRDDDVYGKTIDLDRVIPEMPPDRFVLVAGQDAFTGEARSETARVKQLGLENGRSVLVLAEELAYRYARASVVVHGNTAAATHGASVAEVAGSGDASVPHLALRLRQPPLTWIAAPTPRGNASTLELRVEGVLWRQVESLYTAGPNDLVYELTSEEDGSTIVQFGDGVRGARVPSGSNNISVRYRKGIGVAGNLAAGQLSLLQSRPQGLSAVVNPGPARGAADPERLADIRKNAPLTILTMERLVSLADYEDFARAFAGIGKVKATDLWDGKRGFVHITVADGEGQPFAERAETLQQLERAYKKYQDPAHVVIVSPHVPRTFGVTARVLRDDAFDAVELEKALEVALARSFGFAARGFGLAVSAGEVTTALHGVPGVVAVDLDAIYRTDDGVARPLLPAQGASWSGREVVRAELLLIDPERIAITWMSAAAERDA